MTYYRQPFGLREYGAENTASRKQNPQPRCDWGFSFLKPGDGVPLCMGVTVGRKRPAITP
jgi:hypothetical protein